jgi:hypothetical protein
VNMALLPLPSLSHPSKLHRNPAPSVIQAIHAGHDKSVNHYCPNCQHKTKNEHDSPPEIRISISSRYWIIPCPGGK